MVNEENKIKKYYIADAHFGHKNILMFDKRPWFDVTSMRYDMIKLWNNKVRCLLSTTKNKRRHKDDTLICNR